jgi:uncharacterized membrane protein
LGILRIGTSRSLAAFVATSSLLDLYCEECIMRATPSRSAYLIAACTLVASAAETAIAESSRRIQPTDCWEMRSLGTFGGNDSWAVDVNDSGQVVGTAATVPEIRDPADPPVSMYPAFISAPNGGALTAIFAPDSYFGTAARAVNNAGEVVGDATIGRSYPVGFVTDPGGANPRNTLSYVYTRDINNLGQTLWDIWYPYFKTVIGPNDQPTFGDPAGLIEVNVLPDANYVDLHVESAAFNDAGQVAITANLYSQDSQDPTRPTTEPAAYRWSSYEGSIKLAPDAIRSRALDINSIGQVVGVLTREGAIEQAFVTRRYNTSLEMLGNPGDGNMPTGINYFTQIVGTHNVNGVKRAYVTVPFFVHRSIDIDSLPEVSRDGWSNLRPEAINNRGQIAGTGTLEGFNRAFLLSPLSLQAYLPTRDGKHPTCYRIGK